MVCIWEDMPYIMEFGLKTNSIFSLWRLDEEGKITSSMNFVNLGLKLVTSLFSGKG